jgi:colanic acid biosynthesis protein WcaH
MSLSNSEFKEIVRNTPLVSIDLVIADPSGAILMGWRENEPAKGTWFVPGGRIRKSEKIADAFERIVKTETGLAKTVSDSRFGGVYEHLYPTNQFGDASFGTHYCVLAYILRVSERPSIAIDSQHSMMDWLTPRSANIHPYSLAYFDLAQPSPHIGG